MLIFGYCGAMRRCELKRLQTTDISSKNDGIFVHIEASGAESYTGHCFRRSSASSLANQGGDIISLKRLGGWKSNAVAEGYVDQSKKRRIEVANILSNNVPGQSTSSSNVGISSASTSTNSNQEINLNSGINIPSINITGNTADVTSVR